LSRAFLKIIARTEKFRPKVRDKSHKCVKNYASKRPRAQISRTREYIPAHISGQVANYCDISKSIIESKV